MPNGNGRRPAEEAIPSRSSVMMEAFRRLGRFSQLGPRRDEGSPGDAYAFPGGRSALQTMFAPPPAAGVGRGGATRPAPPPSADAEARAAIAADNASVDPRGQGASQRIDQGSADVPLPKVGTGQEAVMDRGVASRDIEAQTQGRVRAVTKPDGDLVFTNLSDEDIGAPTRLGEVGGAAGQAYVQPGGEMEAAAAIPEARGERGPGWALRKVLNQQHAAGDLSMDPRDVSDRQRFEAQTEEEDMRRMILEAQMEKAVQPEMRKFPPAEVIKQRALQERSRQARDEYGRISDEIESVRTDGRLTNEERDTLIGRLERERQDLSNILMGFTLKDPRQEDPMAAMFAALAGPQPTGEP